MFAKFWNDESGIVALEYLLVATIVGLGLIVGLTNLTRAINVELTELGNAILGLSQAYIIDGASGCAGAVHPSSVTDAPGSLTFVELTAISATSINVVACP